MNTPAEPGLRPHAFRTPYVEESATDFRVSTAAYRDPEIFEAEMKNIFYSTWIYLGHESEVPNPGDFKSTWIGLQPVILTRDQEGKLNALYNACTHRGGNLCREERGNTRSFVCPYHGWSFRTDGSLMAIPAEERYPAGYDRSRLDMRRVPRLDTYGGLIFASVNPDVCDLKEHLGSAMHHIDVWNARQSSGTYRAGTPHRYAYHGNWKFQSENVYDGYHAGFTHRSAFNTFRKFPGLFRNRHHGAVREDGLTRGMEGGHGSLELSMPLASGNVPEDLIRQYEDGIAARIGRDNVPDVLRNRHVLIWPNVIIMDFNIRHVQPRAHNRTEIYSYPMLIDGIPEISAQRMNDAQQRVGVAGVVGADDIDVFNGNQTSLGALGNQWFTLARGLDKETIEANGDHVAGFSDEAPQRAFWRQWDKMMSAGSKEQA